jgi:hypothetical protein
VFKLAIFSTLLYPLDVKRGSIMALKKTQTEVLHRLYPSVHIVTVMTSRLVRHQACMGELINIDSENQKGKGHV